MDLGKYADAAQYNLYLCPQVMNAAGVVLLAWCCCARSLLCLFFSLRVCACVWRGFAVTFRVRVCVCVYVWVFKQQLSYSQPT
jgi:hypothetical protein